MRFHKRTRGLLKIVITTISIGALIATNAGAHTEPVKRSLDQRAATWQKTTYMKWQQGVARANGSPSPHWPTSRCLTVRCPLTIARLSIQRVNAEKAWNEIRYGTNKESVRKIIRYWFRGRTSVAFQVASCENSFNASNGPSPTGDWGAWQINYSAHSRAFGNTDDSFFRVVLDPWEATQVAFRWSSGGTNFSPTWVCATIHGIP